METKRNHLFNYHKLSDKEKRNLVILRMLIKKSPISRTEIADITEINIVSISNYVKDYIAKDLVVERESDVSTGGRKPELIELNKKGVFVIGLEIGALTIRAALCGIDFGILQKLSAPRPQGGIEAAERKSVELVRELVKNFKGKKENIRIIGAGIFGNNFNAAGDVIEKETGIPTFIASDAACAAFGEKTLNQKADVENLLYMHSDVGCGIVISGDIYFGSNGNAGGMHASPPTNSAEEAAHVFNRTTYLKPWAQGMGMVELAKKEARKGIGTKIVEFARWQIDDITNQTIIEAAKSQDEVALDIVKYTSRNLGVRIAYLVNLFNPEVIIIGGGTEKAGELVIGPISDTIKKLAESDAAGIVNIIPSALGEDAVSLGAASLAVRELFIKA